MRIEELKGIARRRKLDAVFVMDEANVLALTGVRCDNAVVTTEAFYTDFRYAPMVRRVAPGLKVRNLRTLENLKGAVKRPARRPVGTAAARPVGTADLGRAVPLRIGCEFTLPHARFQQLQKLFRKAKFVDIAGDLAKLRSVKTADEIAKIRAAEALTCAIWSEASSAFRPGMTEREMARLIQRMMIERGDGEAFATIVCVGANAAECHHEPDDTVWNGREPVLVDMGVKLDGVCADLTRNWVPPRPRPLYRKVYDLVLSANRAAIAAARPGMTAAALDKVARDIIRRGGFGKCFGHSLGHGVGYEIHEAPTVSKRDKTVLKPGMTVTVEPGIYLEGNLGVRIEDLVLITETGCEVLSAADFRSVDGLATMCYNVCTSKLESSTGII